ncbi:Conserved_hypothetical protein [Hexamita inflata]|uniref:Uncharacterized protein n=1 Tax=Hexamita inflata TaxID=28002 RepID=A0AA86PPG8_9EUKA|nr:Conserved hypothetical protein [Hexamita inflata]
MIFFLYSQNLLCFQTNTTVLLDVQTRELVFKAWPRTDSSRETSMCQQLNGDSYKLSIIIGTYIYKLQQLVYFDMQKVINVNIPCAEAVGSCQNAFKAKSAIFTMEYQLGKQNVTEVVSNLRRLDFNRSACGTNTTLISGRNVALGPAFGNLVSNVFIFSSIPQKCKYPIDTQTTISAKNPADKKAIMHFVAYPNYYLISSMYSLPPDVFIQNQFYPCELLRLYTNVPTVVDACNSMSNYFTTSSFAVYSMAYYVPGIIPNRDGTLTRQVNYTSIYASNKVKDTLDSMFDCYADQKLIVFGEQLLLSSTLNDSMQYCKQPINKFIQYPFDKMVTRITFQENTDFRVGNVYVLDYVSQASELNTTVQWLSCEMANKTLCLELFSKIDSISSYILNAQQLFYKGEQIVQLVQLKAKFELSCYLNSTVEITNTEACVQLYGACDNSLVKVQNKQFTYYFGDTLQKQEFNISVQTSYPNKNNKYCVNFNFTTAQIQNFKTGYVQINDIVVPIVKISDLSKASNVKNIHLILIGVVVIMIIFVGLSVVKPWV